MQAVSNGGQLTVYVGTYTHGGNNPAEASRGIYRYGLDMATGELTYQAVTEGILNPSFLALSPSQDRLCAVSETPGSDGFLCAYRVDAQTGDLIFLNRESTQGESPAYVAVTPDGRCALVSNYSSGKAALVFPIKGDGSLEAASSSVEHEGSGPNEARQEAAHPHAIVPDPSGRYAYVPDLGMDKVMIYRLDTANGWLTPTDPPGLSVKPGAGPRHLAFHPNGRFTYLICELDSTVVGLAFNCETGGLDALQTVSTLPEGYTGENTAAEICVSPDGRFVYGSNRGHDSIVIYTVDAESGQLSFVAHQATQGKQPRYFGIDPTGMYLLAANQGSDTVVTFRIDRETGRLAETGYMTTVPMPVCIAFLRS